ncbi:adenosylcobinamide amidohydrolase [Paenibacillus sp. JX-17]|uniref:Adenosylcobinamide amidohydrolase n=1 Tax=Paenibacillus lacisoli TaxID=3064525 RepID=A0ABT9CDK1_9BACL|nr:adenosylcobinamide amidohydrolase [Paenibacillus sp. JX-17]MDO7907327.1 adenosylcobinamide amidohydrolase [Paenibacillus sp. JX-17]
MSLPFLQQEQGVLHSELWPGLTLSRGERHLRLRSPVRLQGLSSAVHGGGRIRLDQAVNIYVDRTYQCDDPVRDIRLLLEQWQYPVEDTAALLTAVNLGHASIMEAEADGAVLFCCATGGATNAARAGSSRTTFAAAEPFVKPGTINIMLFIDGQMTEGAMVNVIQTAVEAKTAALLDLNVADPDNGLQATGTTTDAIVLGVSQKPEAEVLHRYAGTATELGAAIGRLVYGTVRESLEQGRAMASARLSPSNNL